MPEKRTNLELLGAHVGEDYGSATGVGALDDLEDRARLSSEPAQNNILKNV